MSQVCRICLCDIEYQSEYYPLNIVEEQTGFMPIRDKLTLCVPEIALDLIVDALICSGCKNSLQIAYDFKQLCLDTEKKLHRVMRHTKSDGGNINLQEILHLLRPKEKKKQNDSAPVIVPSIANIPAKNEIVIESYSELKSILVNRESSEGRDAQSITIDIKDGPLKEEETYFPSRVKKLKIDKQQNKKPKQIVFGNRPSIEVEEIFDTTNQQNLNEEELSDEAIQENFVQLISFSTNEENCVEGFMCKICTVKLKEDADLRHHFRTHQNSVNHTCYVCNRKFKALHYLRRHEKTHTGTSALYKCKVCGKIFKDRCSFQKHTHDDDGAVIKAVKNRNNLPKEAKRIMKQWLYEHRDNPYPTDVQKQEIVKQTNLKYIQVENWFVNARRRILNKKKEFFVEDSP